jgi:ABC-type antimicrobial peptide transport system permease subunit
VAGRDFDARDTPESTRVAIVNEAFVSLRLGSRAIGTRVTTVGIGPDPDTEYEVIGVVGNQKYSSLRDPFPPIFYPASSQTPTPGLTRRYLIKSSQPTSQTIASVAALLREVNPDITVRYLPLDRQIAEAMLQERLLARLSLMFGCVALALAVVGLYGVVAYGVASRRGEIGIRVALGARRWRIVALVLREAGLVLAGGLAAGLVVTLAVTRAVRSLLFGLSNDDPAVLSAAVLILAVTGLMAAAIPARRAAAIDPVQTLRE